MSITEQAPVAAARSTQLGLAVELVPVAIATLLVLLSVAPDQVFQDSMPFGGDLTGHVVVPWADRQDLLAWLPGSWSWAMFNGFPINQLYPALPSLLAALLSFLVPLAVAIKIVVVLPLIAMPWAAWQAARWAGLPQSLRVMAGLALLPLLFDRSCASCGGTIATTIGGEYSYTWGLLLAVLALGAVERFMRDGRGGVIAALLAASAVLSHPLPAAWLVTGVVVLAIGHEIWREDGRRTTVLLAALAATMLGCLWWVPFLASRAWMTPNPLVREGTLEWLFPASGWWELAITALAVVGAVRAIVRRRWYLIAYAVGAALAVIVFLRLTDGGPFYSIRVLPMWELGRWTLAGVGFVFVADRLITRLRADRGAAAPPLAAPVAWLIVCTFVIGTTSGWWAVASPATPSQEGRASILGIEFPVSYSFAHATMAGFAARSDYPQLQSVQQLLRDVAERRGCGSLMWDNGDPVAEGGQIFGDPQVFWQSAMWTNGCIPSADGVLVDSSRTASAMQATKSLVSQTFEPLVPDGPQFQYDLSLGAQRMRDMGIRYYLTHGGRPAEDAKSNELLALVASAGPWQVWEVDKGVPVISLGQLPAVFDPPLDVAEFSTMADRYYTTSTFGVFPLVQSGPSEWPRAGVAAPPSSTATDRAGVSDIVLSPSGISFKVQRTGLPVVVRVSAFPGWSVSGAQGPYRATPNYVVVVPTATDVTLTKGRTWIDWVAITLAILGAVLLVVVGLRERRDRLRQGADGQTGDTEPDPGTESTTPASADGSGYPD